MRPGLVREIDLRDTLGKIKGDDSIGEYLGVVEEMKRRMDVREYEKYCQEPLSIDPLLQRDMKQAEGVPIEQLVTVDSTLGIKILPHWLAQPYWRPLPPARTWDFPLSTLYLIDDILSASQSKEATA